MSIASECNGKVDVFFSNAGIFPMCKPLDEIELMHQLQD